MASVKANWHLADIMSDDGDPLDIRTVGTPITLNADLAPLRMELRGSLHYLNRLYAQGLSCELSLSGQSCHGCQERVVDPEDPMSRVCRSSMRQEFVVNEIERLRRSTDAALSEAIVEAHGNWAVFEAQAVAEAHADWALTDAVGV